MITLLADTNALRHQGLKSFLQASRDHTIALSDLTLVEMHKKNALSTARESLQIVRSFPSQVYVLKRTDQLLDANITSSDQTSQLIDFEAGVDLAVLASELGVVPTPVGLPEHMEELERDARLLMERLSAEVAELEPGLIDAAKDFSNDELVQIRTGEDVTDQTRDKLRTLLKDTTARFILQNQQPGRREPLLVSEARGMFGFRYSLCMVLYYMEWVRLGRTGKKLKRRVNDVIDKQVAALGTYFNGVLSADGDLQDTSYGARRLLRGFGAFVGDDWQPHIPDGESAAS